MQTIPNAHDKVPMMFRAQVRGRSQLQYLDPQRKKAEEMQDVELWTDEWVDKAEFIPPDQAQDVQTLTYGAKSYKISWRFVTNGGQDDGMLRPVIGASGIPFYPGSSMKGAFRHACEQMQEISQERCNFYCGNEQEIKPGVLRFLGAYPINDWTAGLLDLVHPQQCWQVKTLDTSQKPGGESAYAQVSLYQPTLWFAISSLRPLTEEQWQEIWQIWERAIALGIGSEVSTGYGQIAQTGHKVLYQTWLKGQGQAAKRIDEEGEFRHNVFRAGVRGHALRIFGGLTDKNTAEQVVDELFGGIQKREPTVGLLGMQFQESKCEISMFGSGNYAQPAYQVEGKLTWFLTQKLSDSEEVLLKKLVAKLMQFAMIVGGFGKSWRRVDHRRFFDEYYDEGYKALIGCHWEWWGENTQRRNVQVSRLEKVGGFFDGVREVAIEWLTTRSYAQPKTTWAQEWREAWHPDNVQVWGRVADGVDDSVAVRWFHGDYQSEIRGVQERRSIYRSHLTGKIGQISRLWHRMYPIVLLKKDPQNVKRPIVRPTSRFLELLTIFPDGSQEANDFLDFLNTHPEGFERIWGDEASTVFVGQTVTGETAILP